MVERPEHPSEKMDDHGNQRDAVICAFCGSSETELISLFGQSLLSSQYYCRKCRTAFESVRWTEEALEDDDID